MTDEQELALTPEGLALSRCDQLIDWYERNKTRQRRLDNALQTAVIVAAGLTAFLAAVDGTPKWAIVLPAVVTTIATGLSQSFRYRIKYVNYATAGERLKDLQLRFAMLLSQGPIDSEALDEFVTEMQAIKSAELDQWRGTLLSSGIAGAKKAAARHEAE